MHLAEASALIYYSLNGKNITLYFPSTVFSQIYHNAPPPAIANSSFDSTTPSSTPKHSDNFASHAKVLNIDKFYN
jgi:hypothetical protein